MTNERLDRGKEAFHKAFGTDAEGFIETVNALAPGLGKFIVEAEFGEAYHRPGLDLKTRELVILASCATLGSVGLGAISMHISAALAAGATREEIIEVFVQLSFSAGFPTALAALECARTTFAKIDDAL